jgi:hypothetical protein
MRSRVQCGSAFDADYGDTHILGLSPISPAQGINFALPDLALNEHGEPRLIAHDSNVTLAGSGIF